MDVMDKRHQTPFEDKLANIADLDTNDHEQKMAQGFR
jgi:hypothetical protein